jgi:hypothetical protein
MIETTEATQAGIEAPVTQPVIVVYLGFSVPLRLSSRGDITWNKQAWTGGRLTSGSVSLNSSGAGGLEGSINLINTDNFISAVVLNEGAGGKSVGIWYLYGTGPYGDNDGVEVFGGEINGVSRMDDIAQIDIISFGQIQWTPRITCTAERFSHMLPAGTQITWAGETFILNPSLEAS